MYSLSSGLFAYAKITNKIRVDGIAVVDYEFQSNNIVMNTMIVQKQITSNSYSDGQMTIVDNEISNVNALLSTENSSTKLQTNVNVITSDNQTLATIQPPSVIDVVGNLGSRAAISKVNMNLIRQTKLKTNSTIPVCSSLKVSNAPSASRPGTYMIDPRSITIGSGTLRSVFAQPATGKYSASCVTKGGIGVKKNVKVGKNSLEFAKDNTILATFKETVGPVVNGIVELCGNGTLELSNVVFEGNVNANVSLPDGYPITIKPPTLTAASPVTTNNATVIETNNFSGDMLCTYGDCQIYTDSITSNDDPDNYILSSFSDIDTYSYSPSVITWNSISYGEPIYGNVKYVAVRTSTPYGIYLYEKDWYLSDLSHSSSSVTYSSTLTKWVAVGNNNISYSTDGINWTASISPLSGTLNYVIWVSDLLKFIVVGNGVIGYSTDGDTWVLSNSTSINWKSVCWSPVVNMLVCVGNNKIGRSSDGINWTITTVTGDWTTITWIPYRYITLTSNSYYATSENGIDWTSLAMGVESVSWKSILWNDNYQLCVAVGGTKVVYTKASPISWNIVYTSSSNLNDITCSKTQFKIATNNILTSTDVFYQKSFITSISGNEDYVYYENLRFNNMRIVAELPAYKIIPQNLFDGISNSFINVCKQKFGEITYNNLIYNAPDVSSGTHTFDIQFTIGSPRLSIGEYLPVIISQTSTNKYTCKIMYSGSSTFSITCTVPGASPPEYNIQWWYYDND